LAVRVREVVAAALERGVKDPRLGMVTITDARVTPDLLEATVFYTVYGDAEAREASARALDSAKGLLRSQVGKATGVKLTPTLTFVHDRLPDDARNLDDLLAIARARDAQLATARAGASPAGEADPYRRPRVEDDDLEDDDVEDAGPDEVDLGDADLPEAGPAAGDDLAGGEVDRLALGGAGRELDAGGETPAGGPHR
jgi:ribosome-binding factor A